MRRAWRCRQLRWKIRARESRGSVSASERNHQRREHECVHSCDGSQGGRTNQAREDRGNIQDKNNGAVTENGSAADQVGGNDFAGQGLDDEFFLADEAIHQEAKTFFRGANDDDEMLLSNGLGVDAAQTTEM